MTDELQASATDPAETLPATGVPPEGDTGAPTEETDEAKNQRAQAEASEESRKRQERKQAAIQRRFDELTREKYEANRRLDELAAQNAKLLAMVEGKPAAPANPEPQRDQFDSYEDFVTARAEYRAAAKAAELVEQRLKAAEQQSETRTQQTQAQAEMQRITQEFTARRAEAEKTLPDFREVIESWDTDKLPADVADTILRLPDGPLLSYHLAKSPELEQRVLSAPPYMRGVIIGEILATLKASSKAVETTKAPAPGKPLGTKVAASNDGEYTGDPEGYYAWARKNLK